MNEDQQQRLRSIMAKCSEEEAAFLNEQFEHAYGVAVEANNPWKQADYQEALNLIRGER